MRVASSLRAPGPASRRPPSKRGMIGMHAIGHGQDVEIMIRHGQACMDAIARRGGGGNRTGAGPPVTGVRC